MRIMGYRIDARSRGNHLYKITLQEKRLLKAVREQQYVGCKGAWKTDKPGPYIYGKRAQLLDWVAHADDLERAVFSDEPKG